MKTKVLFVDDDSNVLEGLQRGLRTMHEKWDMVFMDDSSEALQLLEKQKFDIVITDMKMPKVDGIALLTALKDFNPSTYRIILSGEMSMELGHQAQKVAHCCISKPCSPRQLIMEISRFKEKNK